MKAWIVKDTSQAPSLSEVPVPAPKRGEALIRVRCASLNFSDVLMMRGKYQIRPPLPFVPGQEVSGVIERVAPGSRFRPGDEVATKVVWGGFAEYAIADENMLIRVPRGLALDEAAVLPVVWPTAWLALHHRARLQPGETVLVHAAAGGVGLAATQLAACAGARVIATAGSEAKLELCRNRGAHIAIDYRQPDWVAAVMEATEGRGVDVVIDPVGGDITDLSINTLAYGGRLCIVGFAGGRIAEIKANRLLLRNASALGVYWSHERDKALVDQALADIVGKFEAGRLVIDIGKRYRLEQLMQALEELSDRQTVGKSLLELG